jgi:hypothetical protein
MDAREGRHSQPIVMPHPPIRALNEGDRRPIGVAHIALTAILSLYREVPVGVPVPLATVAVLLAPPTVTVDLLTVHPQTTAPIHTRNRTSLLPKATLGLHHRKWALTIAHMEKRQRLFHPAALSKVRLCPQHRLHSRLHPQLLRKRPLVLPLCPHGRSQNFSRPLPQCLLRHQERKSHLRNDGLCGKSASRKLDVITSDVTFTLCP